MNLRQTVGRRLDPAGRYGLRLTLFALAFALVAVPFGWLVSQVNGDGRLVEIDTAGLERLHAWVRESPWVIRPLKVITDLGGPVVLWIVSIVAVVVLMRAGRTRLALFIAVTALFGSLLDTAVKVLVDRPRPVLLDPVHTAHGKSFPSGHTMSSTVVYGSLLLAFLPGVARRWRPLLIGATASLVLAIGFTRLALGVHFLSDVVGGLVLGVAWLAVSTAAFSIWRVERGRAPVEAQEGLEPEAAPDLPGPVGRPAGGKGSQDS
ncbi:MAG TPA: phosphatase PAP2 family protein [Acidimicrobiales bacterium]|nr:phosphatase PAP2 family protein [Acidimicrobiales bacterium]